MGSVFDGLEQTWTSLRSVLADLTTREWHLPTGCPGWDVQDNVAHICSIEHWANDDPLPVHTLPPHLPHVRSETDRFMELPVDYRRSWTPEAVFNEFCELFPQRLATLRADDTPIDEMRLAPFGVEMPYKVLMEIRVFDAFAHEQDIRRATRRNGNLTGAAAAIARRQMVAIWSMISRQLPELGGARVVLEIDGESHTLTAIPSAVNAEDDPSPTSPTATTELLIRTTFEKAVALACGRSDADPAKVEVIGDRALYEALADRLGFTP